MIAEVVHSVTGRPGSAHHGPLHLERSGAEFGDAASIVANAIEHAACILAREELQNGRLRSQSDRSTRSRPFLHLAAILIPPRLWPSSSKASP